MYPCSCLGIYQVGKEKREKVFPNCYRYISVKIGEKGISLLCSETNKWKIIIISHQKKEKKKKTLFPLISPSQSHTQSTSFLKFNYWFWPSNQNINPIHIRVVAGSIPHPQQVNKHTQTYSTQTHKNKHLNSTNNCMNPSIINIYCSFSLIKIEEELGTYMVSLSIMPKLICMTMCK